VNYQDIINAFNQNLREGLALLYTHYGKKLYGYTVSQWQLLEDESSDILYKTLETVGKVINRYEFQSEKHFLNWLFRIHKNNVLQYLRDVKSKELKTVHFTWEDWENEFTENGGDVKELAELKEVVESVHAGNVYQEEQPSDLMLALEKALNTISPIEKELLILRMSNYSYEVIAGMLQIENNQLKVKFLRAKTKVQKLTLEYLKQMRYARKK
jgi:RNA polymerase sigma-70 factor (ECF subfamily)